jgi:uncharacterized protein
MIQAVPFTDVLFADGFWGERYRVNQEKTLSSVYHQTEKTFRFESLKGEWTPEDTRYRPHVFWDSDIAKWIEAAAYTMATNPTPELDAQLDDIIDRFEAMQQDDGYLNTYFTIVEPDKRWQNVRDLHELYCAGHLIEAAVAHYQATGKRQLLDVMCRYVDYIETIFGVGDGKKRGYPGHQELELALVRLYQVTDEDRYLKLAQYFIDERGQQSHYYDIEAIERGDKPEQFWAKTYAYNQSHLPVREQTTAEGHSVRACYMYAGMADLARLTDDDALKDACLTIWDDVVKHKLYVTGALGSTRLNEGFTSPYDLPDETAYAETCASIALVFWAQRMFHLDPNSRYIDVMERALYNGFLSGLSLDGTQFFYSNPLASHPSIDPFNSWTPVLNTDGKPYQRLDWYECACCPSNIARLIASIGGYFYSLNNDRLYVNLYSPNTANIHIGDTPVQIMQTTDYPWDGTVLLQVNVETPSQFEIALRIPAWCKGATLTINDEPFAIQTENGYVVINREWTSETVIRLMLRMPIERLRANPKARHMVGQIALQRGPIVYCLEEVDNGANINAIHLPKSSQLTTIMDSDLLGGVVAIRGSAKRVQLSDSDMLYQMEPLVTEEIDIQAVPFCFWANRGAGEMRVWIRETDD